MDDGQTATSPRSTSNPLDEPPDTDVKYRSERERAAIAEGPMPVQYEEDDDDENSDDTDDEELSAFFANARLQDPSPPTSPRERPQSDTYSPIAPQPLSPARRPRLSSLLAQSSLTRSNLSSSEQEESPHAQPSFLNSSSSISATADPVLAASTVARFRGQGSPKGSEALSPQESYSHLDFPLTSSSSSPGPQGHAGSSSVLSAETESSSFAFSQEEIQARIRAITRDPNLSEADKSHQRQAILSYQFQQRRRREALKFIHDTNARWDSVSYSNIVDPTTGKLMPGCEHYPRNCKIKASCCGVWVVCRLCHDHPSMDHAIDRFKTEEVMCMLCKRVQPVAKNCVQCNVEFARYFCEKCKFYDNTPGKDIYHCDKCRICRVGKGIGHDNFHCDNCDACVSLEHSKNHRCLKKSLDANCPICGQYLFTSTKPVVFMRCGHTMHSHCFDEYTTEHFTCPLCHKALTNMRPYYDKIDEAVKREEMPAEHRDKVSEVLCHDCDRRSVTPFHFLYHKCMRTGCGSYNTRIIRTYRRDSGPGESSADGCRTTESQTEEVDRDLEDGSESEKSDESLDSDTDSGSSMDISLMRI